MRRKILVVLFFVVVFGLPVTWYLILQVFGENQFVLPIIRSIEKECQKFDAGAYLIVNESKLLQNPNLNKRFTRKMDEVSNISVVDDLGCTDGNAIVFVDKTQQVRGEYQASREDIDRFETEVDIYLMNLKRENEK